MLSKGLCNNTPNPGALPLSPALLIIHGACRGLETAHTHSQSRASVGMFNSRSRSRSLLLPFAAKSCDVRLTDTERRREGNGMEAGPPLTRNLIAQNAQQASLVMPSIHSQTALPSEDPVSGCRSFSVLPKGRTVGPIGCPGWDRVGFPEPRVSCPSFHLSDGCASALTNKGFPMQSCAYMT